MSARPLRPAAVPEVARARRPGSAEPDAGGTPADWGRKAPHSVGDRTPGLARDPDGGLTIYLQPGSPGGNREPNWLPTSAQHPWFMILRMYRPHPAVIKAKWECPGITPVT